jgi:hypothetical protein
LVQRPTGKFGDGFGVVVHGATAKTASSHEPSARTITGTQK